MTATERQRSERATGDALESRSAAAPSAVAKHAGASARVARGPARERWPRAVERAAAPSAPSARPVARQGALDDAERLEALRRRLYREHSTAEDLRRFTEQRGAPARPAVSLIGTFAPPSAAQVGPPADPVAPPPASLAPTAHAAGQRPPAPSRRRRVRRVLVVLAACVIESAMVTGSFLAGAARPAPPSTGEARQVARDLGAMAVVDIGDGRTFRVRRNAVSGPETASTSIDGVAATAQRFHGIGNAVLPLELTRASFAGGRVRVTIEKKPASPLVWRVLRLATRMDLGSDQQVLARGAVTSSSGAPTTSTSSYDGLPPAWVVVEAAADERWAVIAALTDRAEPARF